MTGFLRPRSLSEAVAAASHDGVIIAAGCTDLFPATQAQVLRGDVLDLTAVEGLRGISEDADGWRIGAATTWADLVRAPLPPAFDGLKAAAHEVGSVQIQNAGTIGGNLCNASPAADGVPALLTLDARVELASVTGTRRLPLAAFLTGARKTALRPGEILTAVLIPPLEGQGAFAKLGARRYLVISIVMVAGRLVTDGRHVRSAALAVGACSAVAQRLPLQEAALIDAPLAGLSARVKAGLIEPALTPITDVRADADFRSGSATQMVRRLVARLAQECTR